jgi:Fe-S-cluster containining protein
MDFRKEMEFRTIAESMNDTLHYLIGEWQSICNNCGLCCKNEQFFLNDYDAHMVAMKLGQIGGMDLIKKHIRFNPRPFNVFSRFMFVYEDECPFHSNSSCSFYEHRPMICKLYPVKLSAFLDNSNHNLREPIFFLDKGKDGFGCSSKVKKMMGRINDCATKNTNIGLNAVILYNFFVTTILDDFSFYSCFAQPRGTGQEFFEPKVEDRHWSSYNEIKAYLTTFYMPS